MYAYPSNLTQQNDWKIVHLFIRKYSNETKWPMLHGLLYNLYYKHLMSR